jgi:hypothetical protein
VSGPPGYLHYCLDLRTRLGRSLLKSQSLVNRPDFARLRLVYYSIHSSGRGSCLPGTLRRTLLEILAPSLGRGYWKHSARPVITDIVGCCPSFDGPRLSSAWIAPDIVSSEKSPSPRRPHNSTTPHPTGYLDICVRVHVYLLLLLLNYCRETGRLITYPIGSIHSSCRVSTYRTLDSYGRMGDIMSF